MYAALGGRDRQIRDFVFSTFDSTQTLDPRAELRKDVTIGEYLSGVARFVYDCCLQLIRSNL